MVTLVDEAMKHYRGTSDDIKPEKQANGSSFYEMDTGNTYYYDEDGEEWITPSAS